MTDANGNVTTTKYNLIDRKTELDRPRAGDVTTWRPGWSVARKITTRPWNRLRKLPLVVVALAVVTFVLGLIIDKAALKIIAPLLVIAASILNIASIPSQQ